MDCLQIQLQHAQTDCALVRLLKQSKYHAYKVLYQPGFLVSDHRVGPSATVTPPPPRLMALLGA